MTVDAAGRMRPRGWVEHLADRLIPDSLEARREQILYLVVGGWNTLFGYGVFVALYAWLGDDVPAAAIIVASWAISVANAYLGYRYLVFRSHGRILRELPRFSAVYLLTMAVNLLVFPLAMRLLPLNAYAVQALFTVAVVITSYVGHKHFSFRGGQEPAAHSGD